VTAQETEEAGVTPDSKFLWGLERAIERIDLALTFGKSAKAKKGLAHAHERLMEVKAMIAEKRFADAESAQEQHDAEITDVQETVNEIESTNATEDLSDVQDIESEIQDQQQEVAALSNVTLKVKGELTKEQQAKLDAILNDLKDTTAKADVTVKAKKNKVTVKVKLVEEKENGGKKVTVTHTDIEKKNQGKKSVSTESDDEQGSDGNESASTETTAKGKGKSKTVETESDTEDASDTEETNAKGGNGKGKSK